MTVAGVNPIQVHTAMSADFPVCITVVTQWPHKAGRTPAFGFPQCDTAFLTEGISNSTASVTWSRVQTPAYRGRPAAHVRLEVYGLRAGLISAAGTLL